MMGMEPAGRGERTIGWSVGFGEEEKNRISCGRLKKNEKIKMGSVGAVMVKMKMVGQFKPGKGGRLGFSFVQGDQKKSKGVGGAAG